MAEYNHEIATTSVQFSLNRGNTVTNLWPISHCTATVFEACGSKFETFITAKFCVAYDEKSTAVMSAKQSSKKKI